MIPMKVKTLLIVFFVTFIFCLDSFSQKTFKFSGDINLFHQELTTFMGVSLSKEDQAFILTFASLWDSTYFSEDSKNKIIEISNLLSEKKARPLPHFKNFLTLLNSSFQKDLNENDLSLILIGLINLPSQSNFNLSMLNDFLIRLSTFINDRIIFTSNSVQWKVDGENYRYNAGDKFEVLFTQINLFGKTRNDSLVIFNTNGRYNPSEALWTGRSGTVTWEKAGLEASNVFASLQNYEVVLSRQDYKADSVIFSNKLYFSAPLIGTLSDRISKAGNQANSDFPRFESYRQDYEIDNIFKGFYYRGGLSMQGGRLIGSGTNDNNARLQIYNQDSLLITLMSKSFVFLPNRAFSTSSSLIIHLGKDSIYHPELALNYIAGTDEVSLNRSDRAMSKSPYTNTYHNLDMTFDQLIWKRGDSIMYFTMPRASSIGLANFESVNFFNKNSYERLQGIDFQNPLILVRNFKNHFLGDVLPVTDFANYAKKDISEIRHLLLELSIRGYIFYEIENDYFSIREKLINTLQSNTGKIDYDVINFVSNTETPLENASFNLNTYELQVNGIPRVFISNVQNVNIYPAKNSVTLKKNRSFRFDGIINAGNLTFFGSNFFFDYVEFKITLQNVDSVSIRAETERMDDYGRKMLTVVRNLLRNVTGVLYIDKPDNKSGRKNFADYPKFSSTEKSAVLFNDPRIQKGVYTSEKVYFQVNPFNMDSLNTFKNKDLRFAGKFISGGIFPDIEQNLILQPDYSLGFTYKVPPSGIPAYGGKGVFYESINLSNKGIVGTGKLGFETTEIFGPEFVFFPDSMNVLANEVRVAQKTTGNQFPHIQSKNNQVQWIPETNKMTIRQKDVPFTVHNKNTTLQGNLIIEPAGVSASGVMFFDDARMNARKFVYSATETLADTADFLLKIPVQSENTFTGKNFNVKINHLLNKGEFRSNSGINRVDFPINRYAGYVEKFEWFPKENLLKLISTKIANNEENIGARYVSVHPRQDSLYFISPGLNYNYVTNTMNGSGVQYLKVADALIYPDKGKLMVEAGGNMKTLENSIIIANKLSQLHRIYEASTLVESSSKYTARGAYNYIDKFENTQKVLFDRIEVDPTGQTIAKGKIPESDAFTLSPDYEYQGDVSFVAKNPNLYFKGGARIVHECPTIPKTWLAFETEINPASIYIPVTTNPSNINKDRIFSGSLIANDSIHIYPSFVSFRKKFNDQQISDAGEFLFFEEGFERYLLGSKEKMTNPEYPGNFLTFDRNKCLISSQGKINLDINLGQFKIETTGFTNHQINENSLELDLMITLDFFFNDKALQIMSNDLDSLPGPETVFFRSVGNKMKIQEFIGQKGVETLWKEIEAGGKLLPVPSEINKTITINNVKLKWHQDTRSYQSYGKIEISNIKGKPVHKSVNGFLEISKRRTGDYLDLYIEIDPGNWYYFGYTRAVMMAFSTNNSFNQAILLPPVKQRQMTVKSGETAYIYMIASDTKLANFFERYRKLMKSRSEGETEGEEKTANEEVTID